LNNIQINCSKILSHVIILFQTIFPHNITNSADTQILVFNRTPKAGSQMFEELLRHLAMRNGFRLYREQPQRFATIRLDGEWQKKLVARISDLPQDSGEKFVLTETK
jgi:hypothetical protein